MRDLTDIILGALIFITVDRFCKVVSTSVLDTDDYKRTMLRIELFTLVLTVFIAVRVINRSVL